MGKAPKHVVLLLSLAAFGVPHVAAAEGLPAHLKLVPADAAGFVHIRLADVWTSPAFGDLRYVYSKVSPESWAAFEKSFVPAPSSIDTVTIIYQAPGVTLTLRGQAQDSGALGDTISVLNSESKRVVQAVVSGPDRVSVGAITTRVVDNMVVQPE